MHLRKTAWANVVVTCVPHMQGLHRRKNCHQDIFQWTEEIAITWDKLRAVRRVINKVPRKFQNSVLGFRSWMRSGIFYAVSNPLLSRPGRFLRTESPRVCRNVQYMPLTISTDFWKWTNSTPWKSQKISITFPTDDTTSNILFASELGFYHCMDSVLIRLGGEWPKTYLLSMFSSSAWWRGNCSSSSSIRVIFCSWFNSMANTWRKFSKVQTIQHYAVGHLNRTHNSVRCVAHNHPSISSDHWFHVAHSPSVEISTGEPSLLLPNSFERPCMNFLTQLETALPDKMFSTYTGSMTYEYPWPKGVRGRGTASCSAT
jgi:hypothetical protein